jgi:hypothetical protein
MRMAVRSAGTEALLNACTDVMKLDIGALSRSAAAEPLGLQAESA